MGSVAILKRLMPCEKRVLPFLDRCGPCWRNGIVKMDFSSISPLNHQWNSQKNKNPTNRCEPWANFIGLCRWGNSHGSNRLRASDLPFSMVCGGIVSLTMVFDFELSQDSVRNNEPTNSTESWTNFIALFDRVIVL